MKNIIRVCVYTVFASAISYSELFHSEKLIIELNPKDFSLNNRSGNVLQGISYKDGFWFSTQSLNNEALLINIYNGRGDSIFSQRVPLPSHGQDLSVLSVENGYRLYTLGINGGVACLEAKYLKKSAGFSHLRSCGYLRSDLKDVTTVSMSEDFKYVLIKNKKNMLCIYRNKKRKIEKRFCFKLKKPPARYFQGMVMRSGYIFCLYSSPKINEKKYLDIYTDLGDFVKRIELNAGRKFAFEEGKRWEMEGLSFYGDSLVTSVMTGKNGSNNKRLYQILIVK